MDHYVRTFAQTLTFSRPVYVDLRSTEEYQGGTIPNAYHLPLFSDTERQEIGQLYKEVSAEEARFKGLQITSPKLMSLMKEVLKFSKLGQVVLFCQRGGLRSRSLFLMAHLMEIPVYQLQHGYRGFRRYILEYLQEYKPPHPFVILHGETGAGKTLILHGLQQKGVPVLDLEGLAGHRGSVFGTLGLSDSAGQKIFDANLWQEIRQKDDREFLTFEGESKRIGKIYLPNFLLDWHNSSNFSILITTTLEKRVQRILEEYHGHMEKKIIVAQAREALGKIDKRLIKSVGKEGIHRLYRYLDHGNLEPFVREILQFYYDPLYQKTIQALKPFSLSVDGGDVERAVSTIQQFLAQHFSSGKE